MLINIIFFIYFAALLYITIFCLTQIHLLFLYLKSSPKKENAKENLNESSTHWPMVTIQLPLYNEKYVVDRLVDCVAKIDYPKDKLEIQILDDSNDETIQIVDNKVAEYKAKGFNIVAFRRKNRVGYKAGALAEGMLETKGEFIAIFDADFLPRPSFLKRTVPFFLNPEVGVVQTRWEHINENHSLLTRLQALQLNVHFTVEQVGRQKGDLFLQFNGTAGVWRRKTIEDAGGWQPDTLTEDLDLSYRAQLKNWKIHYIEALGSPAELPAEMNGLKSQQYRWMKGGAETAKKILPKVWKSSMPLHKKFHSTLHLMASAIFLFVFLSGVLSVPIMMYSSLFMEQLQWLSVMYVGMVAVILVYYASNVHSAINEGSFITKILKFIFLFPLFLSLSMGLSLHNSIAVIQGWAGKKSAFIRTPKFNIKGVKDTFKNRMYLSKKIPFTTYIEGILAIYFSASVVYAFQHQIYTMLLFHILLAFGFSTICYYSIKHIK